MPLCREVVVEMNLDRAAMGVRTAREGIRSARRGADRLAQVVEEVVEVRRLRERKPVALERDCFVIVKGGRLGSGWIDARLGRMRRSGHLVTQAGEWNGQ